jgi:hypothetical protein
MDLDRCFQDLERISARTREAFFRRLPIDNIPDVLDIRSLAV